MPIIHVVKPFILQLDPKVTGEQPDPQDSNRKVPTYAPSEKIAYEVGAYDVTDEVANHWYTKMHLQGYEPPPPPPGTIEAKMPDVTEAKPEPEDTAQPQRPSTDPRPAQMPPSVARAKPAKDE